MPVVKLFANLRKLAGTKEMTITESTIEGTLMALVRQNPPLGDVIFKNGGLRPHILIALNGHNISDLKLCVNDQDIIAIFPPIAGG
jgi:MoaD family protein